MNPAKILARTLIVLLNVLLFGYLLLLPTSLVNADTVCDQLPGQCVKGVSTATGIDGVLNFITNNLATALGALGIGIAIIYIIWGGYLVLSSSGGTSDGYKKGLDYVKNAMLGIIIIAAAYLIVQLVIRATIGLGNSI